MASPNNKETQDILQNISGILDSLKQYAPNVDLSGINNKITALESSVQTADDENNKLLLKQNEVKDILDAENNRIQRNINTIEDNLFSKKRAIEMNESQRLRTNEYNHILLIFVISLALIIAISITGRLLPFIPDIIPQILIVLIAAFSIIYIFQSYMKINSRSRVNFNELDLDGPNIDTPQAIARNKEKASKSGDLLGTISITGCKGAACCDIGTEWDQTALKCVSTLPTDITDIMDDTENNETSSESFTTERLKFNKNIVPANSPSEFDFYSKV